ncbi:MAG: hypothetical protein HN929_05310 [Chloroflexi bacterium]|jgi:hypothetical protein|nr:hypothetical protein [Chloroflexota bacterium]MBT7080871.1 hypothetical protein [Chloroflexota bacterium]MBT7290769.1 hypothetical protein [Chloroflexota bacterium]
MPPKDTQDLLTLEENDYLLSISDPVKAINEYIWTVGLTAFDLPEYKPGGILGKLKKLFKRHYKLSAESPHQYIERVLRTFHLYVDDVNENGECWLIAQKRGLSLHFRLISQQMKIASHKSTIYTPSVDDPASVIVRGEVATHHKLVKLVSCSHDDQSDCLKRMSEVQLPECIKIEPGK